MKSCICVARVAADVLRDEYTVSEGFANFLGGAITLAVVIWLLYTIWEASMERLHEPPDEKLRRRAALKARKEEDAARDRLTRERRLKGPPPAEAKFELIAKQRFYDELEKQGKRYDLLPLGERHSPRNNSMQGWRYRLKKGREEIALYESVVRRHEQKYGRIDISEAILAALRHSDSNYGFISRLRDSEETRARMEQDRQREHASYSALLEEYGAAAIRRRIQDINEIVESDGIHGSDSDHARHLKNERERLMRRLTNSGDAS